KKVVRVGRGVKDKRLNISKTDTGIGLSTASNGTRNEVCLVGDKSTVMEGVTPSMIDMTMEKDKLSSFEDTTILGTFPPLPTSVTTSAGIAPGKSVYANITGKPSGKKVNVHTLFTLEGNVIDVVVPVDSIHAISERFANTAYGFFLGKKVSYPVVANYGRSSYARVMVELRADVELKDNITVAMPKITREGHYTCASEKKTVKKPCQTSQGVSIGPKIGKLRLLDNEGNPLVPTGIVESDSEVEVVLMKLLT
nr:hypothetical protein [Tanacetum cinerariifolium]